MTREANQSIIKDYYYKKLPQGSKKGIIPIKKKQKCKSFMKDVKTQVKIAEQYVSTEHWGFVAFHTNLI